MPDVASTPHPRRRALAELDARITEAAAARARRLAVLRAQPASRWAAHLAGMAMRSADERLAMLRRSRDVLAGDVPSVHSRKKRGLLPV